MGDTLTHEMQLNQDATINVDIEDISGRVDILITDEDGEEIYRGDDASSATFTIEVTKKGTYEFSVTGKRAKGGVSFIVEK